MNTDKLTSSSPTVESKQSSGLVRKLKIIAKDPKSCLFMLYYLIKKD